MRTLLLAVLLFTAGRAGASDFALRIDRELLFDVAGVAISGVGGSSSTQDVGRQQWRPSVPSHYAWVERDNRAFWYSAGASAVTTLGTHVLAGIPTLAIGGSLVSAMLSAGSPLAGALAVAGGIYALYTIGESALSAAIAMLVFDSMSETYDGRFISGFFGHFAGSVASTAVTTLTFGGGMLLFHGVGILSEFTGSAGITAIQIFSFLGAMPAVVIAGIALIGVPALATAWALSAGAAPKEGYAIDEQWTSPTLSRAPVDDPARQRAVSFAPVSLPLSFPLALPLP